MMNTIIGILIILFCLMVALNVYFRVKVLKLYKVLVQNEVEFEFAHFFDQKKLEKEVIPRFPKHREAIMEFISKVKFSMTMASILLVLIIIMGYTLLKLR